MKRRLLMRAAIAGPIALGAGPATAQTPGGSAKTYVLVPGNFCGGWFMGPLAEELRAKGHRAFTPTNTGVGERKHLLSRDIVLDTFIIDVMNVIEAEELSDVILVGHSLGGLTVTGVADRMPDRIRHLVYLDAVLIESGQTLLDSFSPEAAAARRKAAQELNGVTVFVPPSGGAIPKDPVAAWIGRRVTPHPFATYETPLKLAHPLGNGLPCTYVVSTKTPNPGLESYRALARSQKGWHQAELYQNHPAPALAPKEVAQLLMDIG
jgi:pimeloyl-ACP methyl ester carboxylesterase